MSDENVKSANDNPNQENNAQQQVPPIVINTQYIKDFSLEIPHAPEVFRNLNQAPAVNIHVDVNASHMHENFFNVELSIAMDGDLIDEKLFILELKYAAVVSLNVPKEHVEPILLVEIPRMLFPFARSIVTNALVDDIHVDVIPMIMEGYSNGIDRCITNLVGQSPHVLCQVVDLIVEAIDLCSV